MSDRVSRSTRVGVFGGGSIVADHHLPLLRAAGVHVAWVADPSPLARQVCHWRFGVRTVTPEAAWDSLHDVDVVLLAIPIGLRDEHHVRLAASGVSVYLEKPIARTTSELDHLIAMYGDSLVVCGFQRRSLVGSSTIRRFLDDRPLGDIVCVRLQEGARTRATGTSRGFRDDRKLSGGGVLTDLGCHGLDLIDQVVGLADATIERQDLWIDGDIERDASLSIRAGGLEFDVRFSWVTDLENELAITCSEGALTTPPRLVGPIELDPPRANWLADNDHSGRVNMTQGFWDVWANALGQSSSVADYSLESTRAVVGLTEQIYRNSGLTP